MPPRFVVAYDSSDAFLRAFDLEMENGGLLVRGAKPAPGETSCIVELQLSGARIGTIFGEIGVVGRIGVAVSFDDLPNDISDLVQRLRAVSPELPAEAAPAEPERRGTVAERVAELSVPQKMQLALAGDRESRIALLRDHNKVLHGYVLRNPRIGIDEVLFAAKLTTLSPDALKQIGEQAEWSQNPGIVTAIVRNPNTPMPAALRLLPRLPTTELRAVAKGGARDTLVQAARKIVGGGA